MKASQSQLPLIEVSDDKLSVVPSIPATAKVEKIKKSIKLLVKLF